MLLFSLIFFIFQSQAKDWSIMAGPSITAAQIRSDRNSTNPAPGIHSHVVYDAGMVVLRFSSYWHWSFKHKATINFRETTLSGEGEMRSFSLGPMIVWDYGRQQTWGTTKAQLYGAIGPMWSLHSLQFEDINVSGEDFQAHQKITYEGRGVTLSTGVKLTPQNSLWGFDDYFIELSLSYLRSTDLQVIGGTKIKVETLDNITNANEFIEYSVGLHAGAIFL